MLRCGLQSSVGESNSSAHADGRMNPLILERADSAEIRLFQTSVLERNDLGRRVVANVGRSVDGQVNVRPRLVVIEEFLLVPHPGLP